MAYFWRYIKCYLVRIKKNTKTVKVTPQKNIRKSFDSSGFDTFPSEGRLFSGSMESPSLAFENGDRINAHGSFQVRHTYKCYKY